MAKNQDTTKPIFPLKHEFYASMDHFIHVAGMLADATKQAVELGAVTGHARKILEDRLAAFAAARGD